MVLKKKIRNNQADNQKENVFTRIPIEIIDNKNTDAVNSKSQPEVIVDIDCQ